MLHRDLRRVLLKSAVSPSARVRQCKVTPLFCQRRDSSTRALAQHSIDSSITPLVHFKSTVLQYPQHLSVSPDEDTAPSDTELKNRLDDDCNTIDNDLILETQHQLANDKHNQHYIRHLQNHWNQQQSIPPNHNPTQLFDPFDLQIFPNLECGSGGGGHVVLGRNGSGKTLLSRSLIHTLENESDNDSPNHDTNNPFLHSGSLHINKEREDTNRLHHFLSHVSFESHSQLLLKKNTTTVHRALIPSGGNRLSPTAKFLAVRLGMYPLLPRFVNTLSTGEIRRVLLVRALVSKPELLVLDNAFDGLDVNGRLGLQDIIERVLKGFRMDILVQGVGEARDTARTQVLLLTHRPEEIANGMGKVTFLDGRDGGRISTEDRMGREGSELVKSLKSWEDGDSEDQYSDLLNSFVSDKLERPESCDETPTSHPWDIISKEDLPIDTEINNFWESGKTKESGSVLVEATNLQVTRDDTTLLSHLDWAVQTGERWHLAGTNGAGKSTLSRLLVRTSLNDKSSLDSNAKGDAVIVDGSLSVTKECTTKQFKRGGISWVSTELHLHAAHNWTSKTVLEILMTGAASLFNKDTHTQQSSNILSDENNVVDLDIAMTAANWLGLLDTSTNNDTFLSRSFGTLSQGQQKLLLIASAIAQRPSLLILDEPSQGLDLWNRGHVLALVEMMCQVTDMGLVYVTHHEEELIPSIGHRLCLDDGKVTYCGVR